MKNPIVPMDDHLILLVIQDLLNGKIQLINKLEAIANLLNSNGYTITGADAAPPEGVVVVSLDDPKELHNAIARAVGEPTVE
jgi:dipeptidyl aminopeptidase/acylaminoacyl peptidase